MCARSEVILRCPKFENTNGLLCTFRLLTCTTNVQSLKIFTSVKTRLPSHRSCDWTFIHSKKSSLELDKSQSNSFVKAGKSSHLTRSSSNLEVFESGYCHTRPPLTLRWTLLAQFFDLQWKIFLFGAVIYIVVEYFLYGDKVLFVSSIIH